MIVENNDSLVVCTKRKGKEEKTVPCVNTNDLANQICVFAICYCEYVLKAEFIQHPKL